VDIEGRNRYFAFSYVWGVPIAEAEESFELPGRLPTNGVPRTVEDAISVVKWLGESYLWVDKYWIDQQESESRHIQV
jgi:hypothetical protein